MFAYDQAFSLRCLRQPKRYPAVLVVGDTPLRRHYWANGLKQGLEHLGQQAVLRYYDHPVFQRASESYFRPGAWEGDVIELVEVNLAFEHLPADLIRSSLIILVISGHITGIKNTYAWIKRCSIQHGKQRFYLLGDAPTPSGGSVCEHLAQVTHRFLPEVELRSLSHIGPHENQSSVSFKLSTSMTLYVKVFRQLAFMLYDSVPFESAPSEMLNRMSKEHYVSSR